MSTSAEQPQREDLELLLVHADDQHPVLEGGLEPKSVWNAPKPESLPGRVEVPTRDMRHGDPNDLPAQRWAVVAPLGDEGDALLQAVEPLVRQREQQQGAPVMRYRVCPGMDAATVVKWKNQVLQPEDIPEEEWPRYLLLLGDLHQMPVEMQHVLANDLFVGRLHFAHASGAVDLEGYTAYVEKVLASEQGTNATEELDVLLYTARDGTSATNTGHRLLVEPCQEMMEKRWKPKRPGMNIQLVPYDEEGPEELLSAAGAARSGVMLTVSHGLGKPRGGWASVEQQRATQGALSIAPGKVLTAELLRKTPFLPGGMWFYLACFGAATPPRSAFHAWLKLLEQQKLYGARPESVLENLPKAGERPFLAALPQAVLANPKGPLAVIGHSDLAWTFGFADSEEMRKSRASRVLSMLSAMKDGSRAGVAFDSLMRFYRDVNDDVMKDYEARQEAEVYKRPDPIDPKKLGLRWMLRNDLRGYLLLGDPAVRLAFRRPSA
ncbi:hypothetical protein BO221_23770 [Archangium sp. Cb G35]|uniref:hypothetical protein n=1 Tax=Archangium sp. Cb G35 TaxID=1920190 RepID=UPI00093594AE|nr:hypothetical protein [Archangium sp. Cb G35]OJT21796.1 hypothetical protein BO221_23770 [Archangium sp. Cb G35]